MGQNIPEIYSERAKRHTNGYLETEALLFVTTDCPRQRGVALFPEGPARGLGENLFGEKVWSEPRVEG